jgi:putative NIF3 family GTP cyclohydrolase 1 type 2
VAEYGVSDILAERLGLENLGIPIEVIDGNVGYGRICIAKNVENTTELVKHCKKVFGTKIVRFYDAKREINRVAVGSGACGSLLEKIPNDVDTFITGDVKHSQFLKAKELGITLIDAGHFYTEYVCLEYLQKKINEKFPEVTAVIAENSVDITEYY